MRRPPRDQHEALFVRHLPEVLHALVGEPDSETDVRMRYGSLAIDVSDDPVKRGIYYSFRQEEGGAGFDMLPLLGLAITDVTAWIATLSAAERLATGRHRKPVSAPPSRRGQFAILPVTSSPAPHAHRRLPQVAFQRPCRGVRLELPRSPRYRNGDRRCLSVAFGQPPIPARLAGQSDPARTAADLVAGALDRATGQRKERKERLTWAPKSGWKETAAFRIPAAAGSVTDPRYQATVLVEGVEDALSVRVAGYKGPIAATLGKGGLKVFAPTCAEVVLVPDHDVGDDEILAYVESHVSGGRKVRVARLPQDPNDLVVAACATTCRRLSVRPSTSRPGRHRPHCPRPFTPSATRASTMTRPSWPNATRWGN